MTTQEQYIERLKELVIAEFGRAILTTDDCIALSNAVLESVGISIEIDALEQLFIAEGYNAPRPLMLSSLARYVGYTGWSDFCTAGDITPSEDKDALPIVRRWGVIGLTAIAVIIVIISIVALVSSGNSNDGNGKMVDSRFRNVEQVWLSRTSERCNTLRAYYNEREASRYNQRVDKFIDRYEIVLEKHVKNDLKDYAIQNKITVDNDTIDQTAEIIIENCLNMCENIKID
ncbi:MAG: hypothetical protein IKY56_06415 [Alistipes sp.]|nr:hypothetical protein [Alistipes sp.]MBR5131328.1 hypothetical protein [Alistipes sp.]